MKLSAPKKPLPIRNPNLKIPKGFQLIIDTREQLPLFEDYDIPKIRTVIHDGDYSIKGFEDSFAVERKQVSDFFSYIGKEREKTVKKLKRLAEFDVAILVVEASLDDLISPQIYTTLTANHVFGFTMSLMVTYKVIPIYHRSREVLERFILDAAVKYYNMKRNL
jgi:ERCC4-type nuclease